MQKIGHLVDYAPPSSSLGVSTGKPDIKQILASEDAPYDIIDYVIGANLTGETIGPRIPTKVGRPVLTEDQILERDAKKEERRLANIEATRVRKGEREAKKIAADLEYQEDMKKVLEETGSTYLPTTEKQMEKLSESLKGLI